MIKIKEDKNFLNDIFDWLNWFIDIPVVNKLIIPILLAIIVTGVINKRVTITIEKLKHKNEKDLQIESFYRETGGKQIVEMLDEWASLILDMNEKMNDRKFVKITKI